MNPIGMYSSLPQEGRNLILRIDNPETAYLMAVRAQEQETPKNTTQIIDRFTVITPGGVRIRPIDPSEPAA